MRKIIAAPPYSKPMSRWTKGNYLWMRQEIERKSAIPIEEDPMFQYALAIAEEYDRRVQNA